MAGSNKVFKENEILFKNGDPAEAMYIVRKGALKVFLQKGGDEVTLATLKDGSIVGEMAFFDDKPRSASVKATAATECTVITKGDFEKLLKQIPPWFVAMMKSLSGRLRQTNDRLQALESGAQKTAGSGAAAPAGNIRPNQDFPFQHVLRALQLTLLAFARDGNKDNPKELMVNIDSPRGLWGDFFGEGERAVFDEVLAATVKTGFMALKGSPKPTTVVFVNRGGLLHFIQFFTEVAKKGTPAQPFIPKIAIGLLEYLLEQAAASGYPAVSLTISEMVAKATAKNVANANEWSNVVNDLVKVVPDLKPTGTGAQMSVRIVIKDHKLSLQYLKNIQVFVDAGLA